MSVELRALLLCESAFQDVESGGWHLIGIHHALAFQTLPARGALTAYWSLGGFRGDTVVMVTIRDNEDRVVKAMRAHLPALPSDSFEHAFAFEDVEFQRPGNHAVELHVGDQLVAVRSLDVQCGPTGR